MIIEDEHVNYLSVYNVFGFIETLTIEQEDEFVVISKQQATQLIEVLTKWIETGEVEL